MAFRGIKHAIVARAHQSWPHDTHTHTQTDKSREIYTTSVQQRAATCIERAVT